MTAGAHGVKSQLQRVSIQCEDTALPVRLGVVVTELSSGGGCKESQTSEVGTGE